MPAAQNLKRLVNRIARLRTVVLFRPRPAIHRTEGSEPFVEVQIHPRVSALDTPAGGILGEGAAVNSRARLRACDGFSPAGCWLITIYSAWVSVRRIPPDTARSCRVTQGIPAELYLLQSGIASSQLGWGDGSAARCATILTIQSGFNREDQFQDAGFGVDSLSVRWSPGKSLCAGTAPIKELWTSGQIVSAFALAPQKAKKRPPNCSGAFRKDPR